MCKSINLGILFCMAALISSCDAVNRLHYSVENKTEQTIWVRVPNFPSEREIGIYGARIDTILEIAPNEKLWVGSSPTDIDFPWATKNIYKQSPGLCGLELLGHDSAIKLDCSSSNWKYKKRWSTLKIK